MADLLGFLVILGAVLGWFVYIRRSGRHGAPFVPLEPEIITNVMDLIELKKGEKFYELGSGDGRVVIAAALRGANATGMEIDFLRVWYSRIWIYLLRLGKHARIFKKSFFDVSLKDADVVYTYLMPNTNLKLVEKFKKELKRGTRIVCVGFPAFGLKPLKLDPRGPIYGPIYLYTV